MSKHKQRYWPHSEPEIVEPESDPTPIIACIGKHPDPVERTIGYICFVCFSRIRRQLIELPAVEIWLQAHIAANGAAVEDRVSGSREEQIPLRLDVLDLIGPTATNSAKPFNPYYSIPDDQLGDPGIASFLRSRSEQVHWDTGAAWPEDDSTTGFVAYIAAALSWIVEQDWIDEFMTELEDIGKRARGVAPWAEEIKHEKNGACDKCSKTALVTHVARGRVICEKRLGGCGYDRAQTEYEFRARHLDSA